MRLRLALLLGIRAAGVLAGLAGAAATFGATPELAVSKETLFAGHACALTAEGRVLCWGHNARNQLGQGSTSSVPTSVPAPVIGIPGPVSAMAAGSRHSCAVGAGGSVWCWGSNEFGQLGNGATADSSTPTLVVGLSSGMIAVSAGSNTSCAVGQDGSVRCWGFPFVNTPYDIAGISDAVSVSTGGGLFWTHSCAVTRAGGVMCWGGNQNGELGIGSTNAVPQRVAQPVAGLSGIVAVRAASNHTCALGSLGAVYCWGANFDGEIGDGTTTRRTTPTAVVGIDNARSLAVGIDRSCAALADGSVRCWGDGVGSVTTPVPVAGASSMVAISMSSSQACGLDMDGRIRCWGIFGPNAAPAQVDAAFGSGNRALFRGGDFLCAITAASVLECAGANGSGQLGRGSGLTGSTTPVALASLGAGVQSIAAGRSFTCAITAMGEAKCWGDDPGANFGASTPADLPGGLMGLRTVVAGYRHVCVLSTAGAVHCIGEIGGSRPYQIDGLSAGAASIASGWSHACAVMRDGTVRCWGENGSGELGNGSTTRSHTPAVQVAGLPGAMAAVAAGSGFSCALAGIGRVYCWGSIAGSLTAVPVAGLEDVVSISAGELFACAITSRGRVLCWGGNFGATPQAVEELPASTVGIASGGSNTCAWTREGLALCRGSNREGEVGDGTYSTRRSFVVVRREGGGGTVAGNDWFLDLDPARPKLVPEDKVPPFLVRASAAGADVTAELKYNPQDFGTTKSVYVFALAPESLVRGAAPDPHLPLRLAATGPSGKTTTGCVIAQLDASGQLVGVSSASLHAYVTSVVGAEAQSVRILSGVPAANIGGTTFLIGYGSSSSAMIDGGNNQSVVTVPGTVECRPEPPQTGWWWNPLEDGRGFSIERRGQNLFFASFLYDLSGRSTWLVSSGKATLDGSAYSGDLYSARGGQTLGGAYPGRPALSNVGTVSLGFNTATTGTLVWPGGIVPIQRFDIVTNGLALPPVAGQPESGWWWNPDEDGRGFFLEFQGGTLDIAGYMYDESGNPVWYLTVGQIGGTSNARSFSGNWWSYANGMPLAGPWRQHQQVSNNVAPVTITFTGPQTAIMTLPNGRTTALSRHRF